MEAWRWLLVGVLLGVLAAFALWFLLAKSPSGSLEVPLPERPEHLCREAQRLLAQYRYEITSADCGALRGTLQAAITFIPDKSGNFIPDKSGSLRNVLSLSFQGVKGMGTLLRVHIQALRKDPQGRWRPDPHGPLFLSAQKLLKLLAQRV